MNIKDNFKENMASLSFEIFPPKKDSDIESIYSTIDELALLNPDFISVTYGAAGTKSRNTIEIAKYIQEKHSIPALAHLTCVASTKKEMDGIIKKLKKNNIQNVLALRGDIPEDDTDFPNPGQFKYASDLINVLHENGPFTIAGACYPEGHTECESKADDLKNLKNKVEAGCDFLITQLFFDNECFYDFMERARQMGIDVPVYAGIMPITAKSQIKKMCTLSGAKVPKKLSTILEKYQDDPQSLKEAGIEYACGQINDLISNGSDGIHIYTMNKSDISKMILSGIKR